MERGGGGGVSYINMQILSRFQDLRQLYRLYMFSNFRRGKRVL